MSGAGYHLNEISRCEESVIELASGVEVFHGLAASPSWGFLYSDRTLVNDYSFVVNYNSICNVDYFTVISIVQKMSHSKGRAIC